MKNLGFVLRYVYTTSILLLCVTVFAAQEKNSGMDKRWRTFTSIVRLSDRCVFVNGYNSFGQNLFIDSCIGGSKVKITDGPGYVNDLRFTSESEGWMVVGRRLAQISGNTVRDALLEQNGKLPFTRVSFIDALNGCALADGGIVLCTRDGGNSWNQNSFGKDSDLDEIRLSNANTRWIIGKQTDTTSKHPRLLFRSLDGGKSWERITRNSSEEFIRLEFFDSFNGWGLTEDQRLFVTENSGSTWTLIRKLPTLAQDIFFVDKKVGWLVGGGILQTKDGGLTWENVSKLPSDYLLDRDSIIFLNENIGWLVGIDEIFQSNDGGRTWKELLLGPGCSDHREFKKNRVRHRDS